MDPQPTRRAALMPAPGRPASGKDARRQLPTGPGSPLQPLESAATIEVIRPDSPQYDQVVELSDANTRTLGMLPYAVIREAAADGRVLAHVSAGVVRGYALFSRRVRAGDISLTHLCVGQQHRDRGIARSLVEAIVERHPNRAGIRLSCRKDYDAHGMWPELGFTRLGERPGRSRAGLPLTVWWRTIAAPSLFDPLPDDEAPRLTIALDGRLAREILQDSDSVDTRALTADWVAELAELAVTEVVAAAVAETEGREPSTREPHGFRILKSDSVQSQELEEALRSSLESYGEGHRSRSSSLAVVAQAAVGGASHLLTRDEGLLGQTEGIEGIAGLTVLRPADLLLQIPVTRGRARLQDAYYCRFRIVHLSAITSSRADRLDGILLRVFRRSLHRSHESLDCILRPRLRAVGSACIWEYVSYGSGCVLSRRPSCHSDRNPNRRASGRLHMHSTTSPSPQGDSGKRQFDKDHSRRRSEPFRRSSPAG